MAETNQFFSVWTQESPYWLAIEGAMAGKLPGFAPAGGKSPVCLMPVGSDWPERWIETAAALRRFSPDGVGYRAALIPSAEKPSLLEIANHLREVRDVHALANSLWLIEDLREGTLSCHMQRVIDRRGKQVGFEAFARLESRDGGITGGRAIMQASNALGIGQQLDQQLLEKAIETYIHDDLEGYLFINFLASALAHPEEYFAGLATAAKRANIHSGTVVLDVSVTDARVLPQLATIRDYCRDRGFALALDDVKSAEMLSGFMMELRPSFIKLDGAFGEGMNPIKRQANLRDCVALAHNIGANVLAENIEDKATYELYFAAGVDLFQGYLFGHPARYTGAPTVFAQELAK